MAIDRDFEPGAVSVPYVLETRPTRPPCPGRTPGAAVQTSTAVDYNPFAPDFYTGDPFGTYRRMQDEAPVYYSEQWNWWALTRFADVRKVVQPYCLPRRVAQAEAGIRAVVRELVASWRDRGAVDLAQELAWPMPFDVFFHLMGLASRRTGDAEERARRDQLERWTHELKDRVPGTPHLTAVARAATAGVQQYFLDVLEERRRRGRDDLVTHLVRADIEGVPFVQEQVTPTSEVSGLMLVLFLGGVESTAGLTGTLFKLLADNPDQRALLQRNRSLVPAAVEEALRFATPLQLTARTTSREVTLHGVTIPAGGRVVLVHGAANRDERQFPDPDPAMREADREQSARPHAAGDGPARRHDAHRRRHRVRGRGPRRGQGAR